MSSDRWVAGDTTPKSYSVGSSPYGLTTATAVSATLVKGITTHTLAVTVVDDDTITVDRSGLDLETGVWSLEVEATFPQGVHTFPESTPTRVYVRDDLE